jgi:predicted lactoylglutathione lyase
MAVPARVSFRGAILSIHTASTEEVDEAMRAAEAAGAAVVKPAEASAVGVYAGLFALGADGRYVLP